MSDFIAALVFIVLGGTAAGILASSYAPNLRTLIGLSFVAHVLAAVGQISVTLALYGGGDIFGYSIRGEWIAALLRLDFGSYFPEVVKMLFHDDGVLPLDLPGIGSSTASMAALTGLIDF